MQHIFGMYKIMQEVREVHIPEKAELGRRYIIRI